jgi:hypothetical protein
MPKKYNADAVTTEKQTPEQTFKALIGQCIETYAQFLDDGLSLDYNRVTDTKLRAMILQDREYRRETKYIRAKKIMDEIQEMDELNRIAAGMSNIDAEDEEDEYDVRGLNRGKKQKKKPSIADKDMLNMRFKAAQERRTLIEGIAKTEGDEVDVVNLFFIPINGEEFARLGTTEVVQERDADEGGAMEALAGALKEKLPEGEKMTNTRLKPENTTGIPALGFDEEGNIISC